MRLIDADEIMRRLSYNNGTPTVEYYNNGDPVTFEMREIKGLIRNAPTVSPWVKTADRLPTDNELRDGRVLLSGGRDWYSIQGTREILEKYPQFYPYWMAIPPLPEVDHVNS